MDHAPAQSTTYSPRLKNGRSIFAVYVMAFFVIFHLALPAYINSSFISQFVGTDRVGIIYIAAAVLSLILIALLPRILSTIGNFWTAAGLTVAQIAMALSLAVFNSPFIIIPFFVTLLALVRLIALTNDIFLEHNSDDESTGSIRGAYLTIGNTAWFIALLITGILTEWVGFQFVYMATALILIPFFIVLWHNFRNFQDPVYDTTPFFPTLARLSKDKDMWNVTLTNLMLQFFYASTIIYAPIYLYEHIGLSWAAIGTIFAIMHLPFMVIEIPAGRIADKFLGEKEMMIAGFLFMAAAAVFISLFTDALFLLWLLIFILSRVGAALTEVTTESYFFKHIDSHNANFLNIFRSVQHISYILAPLFGTMFLAFFDIRFFFATLALIMLCSIWFALRIVDTK